MIDQVRAEVTDRVDTAPLRRLAPVPARRAVVSRWFRGTVACVAILIAGAAVGQVYPTKPIRLIVPWPPGGAADVAARPVAEKLSRALGQPIIVENRAGATGTIGAALVAKAPPDGYTLLFATSNEITMSPAVYENMVYDPTVDLAPITAVVRYPNVLVVGPALKVGSVKELIAVANSRPGGVSFASGGLGSTNHLTLELLKTLIKVNANHVPYKGGGPALNDLIGGHVDALFATLPSAVAHVREGTIKALVVTSERRATLLPDTPSAVEAGVPGLIVSTWSGIFAPPKTPRELINKLNTEIIKVIQAPELKSTLQSLAAEVYTTSPEEFAAIIKTEFAMWSRIAKDANVKLD
jgi:tripartite-type tricarboxylate transporter receptor subunit TctC